eukprot:TRINITY_DN1290_c0_g2_i4.p1 TRINITY_DN1290_c0_g2~~TRINITY_DN1290_c0_g2_i4.p1  ORF type:complete len:903 (+),score=122.66 TRINITY_DN1290_c0_g2_i4:34-2742(+)
MWQLCGLWSITVLTIVCAVLVHGHEINDIRIEYKSPDLDGVVFGIDVPQPRFSWSFSGQQVRYNLHVHKKSDGTVLWKTAGAHDTLHQTYAGLNLEPDTRYVAKLDVLDSTDNVVSKTVEFHTGLLGATFQGLWIGSTDINMNQLRKEFNIPSVFNQATAFICGLGYYELYVNGKNVDPTRKLDPGYTTFEVRSLYASFDVTNLLTTGSNAIGVLLGNGWYSQDQSIPPAAAHPTYGPVKLIFQLNVVLLNGTTMSVVSDLSWMGRQGPIVYDSLYHGEVYDARLEREGWANPGFVDPYSDWIPASQLPAPGGILTPQMMEPIRVSQYLYPVELESYAINSWTYDFGQNFAGWIRIKVKGARGTVLNIQYGEILGLRGDNYLYINNLRGATQRDTYILKGDPNGEIYEPRFTYHGFRYIQLLGTTEIPASDITGVVVHSAAPAAGSFVSDNEVINQIQSNVQWGQRSNIMSIPTDCPQRDERKGWMGDAGLTCDEANFNFYLPGFYTNWAQNIRDAQDSITGMVPDTVPFSFGSRRSDPNWGTAYPTTLFNMFDHYGDVGILQDHYPAVKAWVNFLAEQAKQTGVGQMYCNYGDWVQPPPQPAANCSLVSAGAYAVDVKNLAYFAGLLGKTTEQKLYTALYQSIQVDFHKAFWNAAVNGYGSGYQTENAYALGAGLVPANLTDTVARSIAMDILMHDYHCTTGILGTRYLFETLSINGFHDMALTVASQVTYPSYGFSFNNPYENATTIWERWDDTVEGPGMDSRNHPAFGSIGAWFYRYVAGIKPNALREVEISPAPVSAQSVVKQVSATHETLKGTVSVYWKRDTHHYLMKVQVPTVGRVVIPKHDATYEALYEGGRLLASPSEEGNYLTDSRFQSINWREDGSILLKVLPGSYTFEARI